MSQNKPDDFSKGYSADKPALSSVSRRDILKFCTVISGSMGLPLGVADLIAKTVENPRRPPVIWLHFHECTGCTESLLRATHPTIEHLVLDLISLDYSETVMTAAYRSVKKEQNAECRRRCSFYKPLTAGISVRT